MKVFIVAGLGFGDEGKGTITEFLAQHYNAKCVVRYNGGPQAAHHVVRPDGSWHCFSQFGSGSFLKGVRSHLAHSMLIKPSNLLAERDELIKRNVVDINSQFTLDPSAYLVTPWHAMLCRMEEVARGANAHGSVGMGVGKAAFDRRMNNPHALQIRDLLDTRVLNEKLKNLWESANVSALELRRDNAQSMELKDMHAQYVVKTAPEIMLREYEVLGELLRPNVLSDHDLQQCIGEGSETIVLEGAQGVLLDFKYGFLPHVTKTDVTFNSAQSFLSSANIKVSDCTKVGILRAYSTRHGAGPFVTQNDKLNSTFPELHNKRHRWQGEFRVGYFDLVASRYACAASGSPDMIAMTHLDTVGAQEKFYVCESYRYTGNENVGTLREYFELAQEGNYLIIHALRVPDQICESRQRMLTKLISECIPHKLAEFRGWGGNAINAKSMLSKELETFIHYLQQRDKLGCQIKVLSFGPTINDKVLI